MDKDVLATEPELSDGDTNSAVFRGKTWSYALFFGAAAGMAVWTLNIVAVAHHWQNIADTFELLNLPITSSMYVAEDRVFVAIQWPIIGMFLGSMFCLARDRVCRRNLLIGIAGGILIGGLDLLATANSWFGLRRCFEFLDQPIIRLMDAIGGRLDYEMYIQNRPAAILLGRFLYSQLTFVAYWIVIGLLLASVVCAFRIIGNRREENGE